MSIKLQETTVNELKQVILDLLVNNSEHIQADTGLSDKRCEEILQIYYHLRNEQGIPWHIDEV